MLFRSNGSDLIPGASTINFDTITKERIFKSLNEANLSKFKDLKTDFELLKFKLGYTPMMMDFIEHGSRDPFTFVNEYKSYYGFLVKLKLPQESEKFLGDPLKILESLSLEVLNGKRLEESLILFQLLQEFKNKNNDVAIDIAGLLSETTTYTYSIKQENIHEQR